MSRGITIFIVLFISFIAWHSQAFAQSSTTSCGSIIKTGDGYEEETLIADCSNPFNADENAEPMQLFVDEQEVVEGDVVLIEAEQFPNVPISVVFANDPFLIAELSIFKQEGEDYVLQADTFSFSNGTRVVGQITAPGEYVAVMHSYKLFFSDATRNPIQRALSFFIPTTYAYYPDSYDVTMMRFTVEEVERSEPLSDLLLTYEPILQFHEDEDYFPINVDAFVEGSGLWDGSLIDELLIPRVANPLEETNELTLDYLATTTDTSNWYISFSSDEPGEFDLEEAKSRYDSLVEAGKAVPTYYAHQSEHSYVDDLGTKHDFIVLQYWYFYAMNDWGAKGGFNDHEGDWESVFVFLDKDTEEPLYVAFSAHHNDGEVGLNPKQYASVRRNWDDSERNGNQVVSYVSAGSHAMYSFEAAHNARLGFDLTSSLGDKYETENWDGRKIIANNDALISYEGLFGTEAPGLGRQGTQGPYFTDVGTFIRFREPVQWAGIDQITEIVLDESRSEFDLPDQNAKIIFGLPLPPGTEFSSMPHDEFISFGSNSADIQFLPRYWDINVSEPNSSFTATTTFSYSDEDVSTLGLNETNFGIYFYNDEIDFWEIVPSTANTTTNTISFATDHFSIYAIGELPEDTEESEEEIVEEQESKSNSGTRVRRSSAEPEVLGVSTNNQELRLELMRELIRLLKELHSILSTR